MQARVRLSEAARCCAGYIIQQRMCVTRSECPRLAQLAPRVLAGAGIRSGALSPRACLSLCPQSPRQPVAMFGFADRRRANDAHNTTSVCHTCATVLANAALCGALRPCGQSPAPRPELQHCDEHDPTFVCTRCSQSAGQRTPPRACALGEAACACQGVRSSGQRARLMRQLAVLEVCHNGMMPLTNGESDLRHLRPAFKGETSGRTSGALSGPLPLC